MAPGLRRMGQDDHTTPRAGRVLIRLGLAGVLALGAAGCGVLAATPGPATPAPAAPGASATANLAAAGIRIQLAAALGARRLILVDPKIPFRPGEPAELTDVPRSVYQVQLRDDPTGGFIVVYGLLSPPLAAVAGMTLATWLATGPGRVQAPQSTVHVIRQVGADLVYYRWLPGAIVDPETPNVQQALETLGITVAVPR